MNKSNLKYHVGIGMMLFIGSLNTILFDNNDKYDVYVFYDHARYLTNILYDVSILFNSTILTYWLTKYKRRLFRPLFIISIGSWVTYFLFYNQIASLILIPLYIWLVYKNKR